VRFLRNDIEERKLDADYMVRNISQTFRAIIDKTQWLDAYTRGSAFKKVHFIISLIWIGSFKKVDSS
jgi:predicted metalloendopeptidase